jgi:hypothetical protein
MPIWFIALTLCFLAVSCESIPKSSSVTKLPCPAKPAELPVEFEDRDGGLWISYENYRALEGNIIALRTYSNELRELVEHYEGDK